MPNYRQEIFADKAILANVENRLQSWNKQNISSRLWDLDPTIWKQKPEDNVE